jgi:hypothetical protein
VINLLGNMPEFFVFIAINEKTVATDLYETRWQYMLQPSSDKFFSMCAMCVGCKLKIKKCALAKNKTSWFGWC